VSGVYALPLTHSPVNYTREALRLAFPSIVPEGSRFVVILTAYFDDSGTHAGSDAVAVAGYISTPDQWIRFETQWRAALENLGLPMFHMTSFANGVGPYRQWSEPQRRIRLGRLIDIIHANVLGSFGVVVPTEPFNRLFSARAKAHCGGAYGLAATVNFLEVARIVKGIDEAQAWDAWIAYVFESGTTGAGQILKVFQYNEQDTKEKEKLRLLSLRFENKREFVPLQAADILAYELYQLLPRQLGIDPRPVRSGVLSLLAANPTHNWGQLDEAAIKEWAERIDASARLAELLGWPRKRGENSIEELRQRALNRAERQSRRRSKHGR
jgi:hypothetical protein